MASSRKSEKMMNGENLHVNAESRVFNVPNVLSFLRIISAPAIIVMMTYPDKTMSFITAAFFALVCVTDLLDGYLARKNATITTLGKVLDPLADKILITGVFIMLIPLGRIPAWVVAVVIIREIAVTGLRSIASSVGVVMSASNSAKMKTIMQIICLVPLIAHYDFWFLNFHESGNILLIFAVALTVWTGVDYFVEFFRKCSLTE